MLIGLYQSWDMVKEVQAPYKSILDYENSNLRLKAKYLRDGILKSIIYMG
jgi:hypothetical protein